MELLKHALDTEPVYCLAFLLVGWTLGYLRAIALLLSYFVAVGLFLALPHFGPASGDAVSHFYTMLHASWLILCGSALIGLVVGWVANR
jgi:cell division protein FtsX